MAKPAAVIFDTNVWVALFVPTDSQHKKAVRTFRTHYDVPKLVPEYVLLETLTIIKLQASRDDAQQCLDRFLYTEQLEILPASHSFDATITLWQTLPDKHLSFVDMALLALSREYTVVTFDKKLATTIARFR